jgi:hypothetical protein
LNIVWTSYVPRKACVLKSFAFCSIDSISNTTFWVTLSYSISSFISFNRFQDYRPRKFRQ